MVKVSEVYRVHAVRPTASVLPPPVVGAAADPAGDHNNTDIHQAPSISQSGGNVTTPWSDANGAGGAEKAGVDVGDGDANGRLGHGDQLPTAVTSWPPSPPSSTSRPTVYQPGALPAATAAAVATDSVSDMQASPDTSNHATAPGDNGGASDSGTSVGNNSSAQATATAAAAAAAAAVAVAVQQHPNSAPGRPQHAPEVHLPQHNEDPHNNRGGQYAPHTAAAAAAAAASTPVSQQARDGEETEDESDGPAVRGARGGGAAAGRNRSEQQQQQQDPVEGQSSLMLQRGTRPTGFPQHQLLNSSAFVRLAPSAAAGAAVAGHNGNVLAQQQSSLPPAAAPAAPQARMQRGVHRNNTNLEVVTGSSATTPAHSTTKPEVQEQDHHRDRTTHRYNDQEQIPYVADQDRPSPQHGSGSGGGGGGGGISDSTDCRDEHQAIVMEQRIGEYRTTVPPVPLPPSLSPPLPERGERVG